MVADDEDTEFARVPWGQESLYIASPNSVTKKLGLIALATPNEVPRQVVRAIVDCLRARQRCTNAEEAYSKQIRIDGRKPKGQGIGKPKSTADQQLQRMREMYGIGQIMPGGRKKASYLWVSKVSEANYYYGQEYAARDAWRVKLETKGHRLQPSEIHETFPNYLRRIADELEKKK